MADAANGADGADGAGVETPFHLMEGADEAVVGIDLGDQTGGAGESGQLCGVGQ